MNDGARAKSARDPVGEPMVRAADHSALLAKYNALAEQTAALRAALRKLISDKEHLESHIFCDCFLALLADHEGQRAGANTERVRSMALGEACFIVTKVSMDMKDMAESFRVPMDATCEEIITRLIDAGAPRPVERAGQEYRG